MGTDLRASLVRAFFVFALVSGLCPCAMSAMEIPMFDRMAVGDQRDYLKYLLRNAQQLLVEQHQQGEAQKVKKLFKGTGDDPSVGETQFADHLAKMRPMAGEPVDFFPLKVESALLTTLARNGVQMKGNFATALAERVREKPFWPRLPLRAN